MIQEQIESYIRTLPEPKQAEIRLLHQLAISTLTGCKLWFSDGTNEEGKVVANPVIGYGTQLLRYAGGETKEWFQIGISANKTGISVYLIGITDKKYLAQTFAEKLGKASITGYCIKFKTIKDINIDVLKEVIIYGGR